MRPRLVCLALVGIACAKDLDPTSAVEERGPAPVEPAPVEPAPVEPSPTPAAPPAEAPVVASSTPTAGVVTDEPADAAAVEPSPPTVDVTTATALRVRVLRRLNLKEWAVCGILHSVGALEVEVVDAGDPAPRLLLLVSCPADLRPIGLMAEGAVLDVELHRRKQPWPTPHVARSSELPRRYARRLALASTAP